MNDTPKHIADLYNNMIMARSPQDRLRMVSSMFDTAKALAKAGILAENPSLTLKELRAALFVRFYGNDFTDIEIKRIIANIPNMEIKPNK